MSESERVTVGKTVRAPSLTQIERRLTDEALRTLARSCRECGRECDCARVS